MFARYITLLRVHFVPSKAEPVAQGTLVIITLSSEYMKYFQCPQTLGSGHWFFSAFKIPLEVIPKYSNSRATISEPSLHKRELRTPKSSYYVPCFAERSYLGVTAQRFFLSLIRLSSRRLRLEQAVCSLYARHAA